MNCKSIRLLVLSYLGIFFTVSAPASELKDDLDLLRKADCFSYGESLAQGVKNEQFLAYRRICTDWLKLSNEDLDSLLKHSTAAGRLYAAALISEINCYRAQPQDMQSGFKQLSNDSARVLYKSSRSRSEHKVCEIAESFLKKGQFEDFGLSRWCEKPAR